MIISWNTNETKDTHAVRLKEGKVAVGRKDAWVAGATEVRMGREVFILRTIRTSRNEERRKGQLYVQVPSGVMG